MSIRMMPISFVFSRFPRVVRDLAAKLNKQVELVTVGEGTELDKGLIEKIADPLTHLVRNSLDHGIELPEKRAGRRQAGQGHHHPARLPSGRQHRHRSRRRRRRAEPRKDSRQGQGARPGGAPMPCRTATSGMLIFEPGFSTAEVVTDVSGRGVGMDVVKTQHRTRWADVSKSTPSAGVGTRMTIRLPLTLAILDGMSVSVGRQHLSSSR